MVGPRHFNPSYRSGGRVGAASELMRLEIQKKGKIPAGERYKRIMKKKLEESKREALGSAYKKPFSFSDKIGDSKRLSPRAEQALKEIAMKKAKKLAKEERNMVIVQPKNFHNGRITKKGDIFDIVGNKVAKVNTKTGKMTTNFGAGLGRYKPKSMFTNQAITNAINMHSPHFIKLRKEQLAGAVTAHGGVTSDGVINVHGAANTQMTNPYGEAAGGPRQDIGVNAWGAQSNNVWGAFTDNAWGTSSDNVWGSVSTNVWGGIGSSGGLWGGPGVRLWGTGNGRNYLRGITGFFAALFGVSSKKNRGKLAALNRLSRGGGGSGTARAAGTARVARSGR